MKLVAFDVKGSIAHFRRPDTTATHMTYPFITPTAIRGLVGAILGITDFKTDDKVGLQLLNEVQTSAQQLSMLGKPGGDVFNRPTTIELIVNPSYRIFYYGDEYSEQLIDFLQNGHAVYPTFLGAAYALTTPKNLKVISELQRVEPMEQVESNTIIPISVIEQLEVEEDKQYSRAGGFMYNYLGNRTFEKSIDFLYEQNGYEITFVPKDPQSIETLDIEILKTEEGSICLY
ncbi:CRISPR-associated protein Cas5 [Texcoconibacillus texcoconensis]|uniref:CRISPR-associated protein Cas5h n=1 Tax=Texcoconibacillus texcoconensis TaxID=1095777 RepID=A0A840QSD7_9BACI|nr:CRISPR-associated protein Cas5 [Texcoconibacillus texcoconensis]MBB5174422.1 CRISPR-associated protein Cas5h [Texcoconibacillus texcoconensis]